MLLISFENFLKGFPVSSQANHIAMVSSEEKEVYIPCLSSVKASQGYEMFLALVQTLLQHTEITIGEDAFDKLTG